MTPRLPLALVAMALSACARGTGGPSPRTPLVVTAGLPPLRGLWESEGYGYQLEIGPHDELARSQVTAVSCIPTWRARIVARDADSITYQRTDSTARFVLRGDGSPDRLRLHPTQTASEIAFHRLLAPLPACARPTIDTPLSSFDVFATTFAEQYPFFAQHGVDWPAVVARARSQVTERTGPLALFEILQGMIEPLADAHTSLTAPKLEGRFADGRGYAGFHSGPGAVEPEEWDRVRALADRHVTGPLRTFCNEQIASGTLPNDIGYLRFHSFTDFTPQGSFEDGLAALEPALDAVFADAGRWRGLVIDVRTNGGGADPYGLAVAARLTATEYVAYAKQARLDPKDPTRWTAEVPSVVRVSARPGFRGRVILLTGPDTISAGECFAQALLERRPAVERIGQSTQGVFSDVMERVLPNGWSAGVPNERYVTRGRSYDVTGIPPTIAVPLYTAADLAAGRDAALETALQRLAKE